MPYHCKTADTAGRNPEYHHPSVILVCKGTVGILRTLAVFPVGSVNEISIFIRYIGEDLQADGGQGHKQGSDRIYVVVCCSKSHSGNYACQRQWKSPETAGCEVALEFSHNFFFLILCGHG